MPKNATKIDSSRNFNIEKHVNYTLDLFHRSFFHNPQFFIGVCSWTITSSVPCVRILIVRKLQNTSKITFHLDIQTEFFFRNDNFDFLYQGLK